jgi:hypothetical protein
VAIVPIFFVKIMTFFDSRKSDEDEDDDENDQPAIDHEKASS